MKTQIYHYCLLIVFPDLPSMAWNWTFWECTMFRISSITFGSVLQKTPPIAIVWKRTHTNVTNGFLYHWSYAVAGSWKTCFRFVGSRKKKSWWNGEFSQLIVGRIFALKISILVQTKFSWLLVTFPFCACGIWSVAGCSQILRGFFSDHIPCFAANWCKFWPYPIFWWAARHWIWGCPCTQSRNFWVESCTNWNHIFSRDITDNIFHMCFPLNLMFFCAEYPKNYGMELMMT